MAAAIVETGHGRDEVFPDLECCVYDVLSMARPCGGLAPGLTGNAEGALAADELCPAAGWQGHSLRVRGNQTVTTACAIRTSGEGMEINSGSRRRPREPFDNARRLLRRSLGVYQFGPTAPERGLGNAEGPQRGPSAGGASWTQASEVVMPSGREERVGASRDWMFWANWPFGPWTSS